MAIDPADKNIRALNRSLKQLSDNLRLSLKKVDNTRPMMAEIALLLDKNAKLILRGKRSGRKYKRGNRFHQASAEGEPPRTDRGGLRNSVQNASDDRLAIMGSRLKYAAILESEFLNRPWLAKTLDDSSIGIDRIIFRHINEGING